MQVKTRVKAGGRLVNHNETLVRAKGPAPSLKVKTRVKAGRLGGNHNETLVRDTPRQRTEKIPETKAIPFFARYLERLIKGQPAATAGAAPKLPPMS